MNQIEMTTLVRVQADLEKRLADTCGPIPRVEVAAVPSLLAAAKRDAETLALIRESLRTHLKDRNQYKGYSVYQMNDCDWWASNLDPVEAKREYMEFTGCDPSDEELWYTPTLMSEGSLYSTIFNDEDGKRRTFMDELRQTVDEDKHEHGFFFASTEY